MAIFKKMVVLNYTNMVKLIILLQKEVIFENR